MIFPSNWQYQLGRSRDTSLLLPVGQIRSSDDFCSLIPLVILPYTPQERSNGEQPIAVKRNGPSRGGLRPCWGAENWAGGLGTELTTPCMAIGSKIPACSTSWWGG